MAESFFLYGAYESVCYPRFKDLVTESQPAFIRGTLSRLHCGMTLVKQTGDQIISGRLVSLRLPESGWPILDGLSGYDSVSPKRCWVHRQPVNAFLADGVSLPSQTYVLNPEKWRIVPEDLDQAKMATKEWQEFAKGQQGLFEKLTDRQKEYIMRLSRAKGREIIPVDMSLYRELMSYELIVDKGRRLALTKLGQEISLFI